MKPLRLNLILTFILVTIDCFSSNTLIKDYVIKGKLLNADTIECIYLKRINCAYPYIDSMICIKLDSDKTFSYTLSDTKPIQVRLFWDKKGENSINMITGKASMSKTLNYALCDQYYKYFVDLFLTNTDTVNFTITDFHEFANYADPSVIFNGQSGINQKFYRSYRLMFAIQDIDGFKVEKDNSIKTLKTIIDSLRIYNLKRIDFLNNFRDSISEELFKFCQLELFCDEKNWFFNLFNQDFKEILANEYANKGNIIDNVDQYIKDFKFCEEDYLVQNRYYQAVIDHLITHFMNLKNREFKNYYTPSLEKYYISSEYLKGRTRYFYLSRLLTELMLNNNYKKEYDFIFINYFEEFKECEDTTEIRKFYVDWKR